MKTLVSSVLLALALGLPVVVFAEDTYRFEAELAYDRQKSDFAEIELVGASLNYYFSPLPQALNPEAEPPCIGPAASSPFPGTRPAGRRD